MIGKTTFNKHRCISYRFLLMCVSLIFLLGGCGSDPSEQGTDTNPASADSGTGSASFAIQWHTDSAAWASTVVGKAIESCETAGVASITCDVYDESGNPIASGGPWDCSDHQGTIDLIPAGSNRMVTVLGWSATQGEGDVVYQGQTGNTLTINPGEIADVGTIDAHPFVPQLFGPADGESVPVNSALTWNGVTNANQYQVQVSPDGGFASSIIDEQTGAPTYTPLGLSPSTTYYWRVTALDRHGNEGASSPAWHFTTAEVTNQIPTAAFNSPANHATFTQGALVTFSGSASDPEDGSLYGNSLAWSSSIDGPIGSGTSFGTQGLAVGSHTITLAATDSSGAAGSASIEITITNVIDVNIDYDFEYIAEGAPPEITFGETNAASFSDTPVEKLKEPADYGRFHFQRYSYFKMGNSQDSVYSFVLNTNYEDFFEFYVDSNNNEDLTDDGGPIANQGQSGYFGAPVSLTVDVITDSGTIKRP
jgi:hypothetical protein